MSPYYWIKISCGAPFQPWCQLLRTKESTSRTRIPDPPPKRECKSISDWLPSTKSILFDFFEFQLSQPTETVPPPNDSVPPTCQTNCSRIEEEEDIVDAPESVSLPVDVRSHVPAPLHTDKNTSPRAPPNAFKIPLRQSEPITIR